MTETVHCEWCDDPAIGRLCADDSTGEAVSRELCRECLATEMCRFSLEGMYTRPHMHWFTDDRELREHWYDFVHGEVAFDPATVIGV
jgi:hypothetical protein